MDYFYNKFKEAFAPCKLNSTSIGDWSSIFNSNPILSADHLTAALSLEEIKAATFQLGSDKAPGPDGFNLRFYQKFWKVVKDDLFNLFQEQYEGSLNLGPMDYSLVCLIPKKKGVASAREFRPINLINGAQKIISMILANRLESVMKDIISPSQSAATN